VQEDEEAKPVGLRQESGREYEMGEVMVCFKKRLRQLPQGSFSGLKKVKIAF